MSHTLFTFFFFFFNDPATPAIYTLSLHDALPICHHLPSCGYTLGGGNVRGHGRSELDPSGNKGWGHSGDRKSTRLNSSHEWISYAVFCLKKKKKKRKKI